MMSDSQFGKPGATGPLAGVKVVEMGGLGPAPFGVMLLADLGASVVRVDRPVTGEVTEMNALMDGVSRGRTSLALDLKAPEAAEIVLDLVADADVLIDPFRPGVMERLGLGPEVCMERNERLIYVRMTGYGQTGRRAKRAGHDINFIAQMGVLYNLGRPSAPPVAPGGYIGDFGGGGTFLALGVSAALFERTSSGRGQVIDVAITDGVAALSAYSHGLMGNGMWSVERGETLADGGYPFYDCYETSDGGFMAVGSMEPQFYATLLTTLGLDPADWPQYNRARWRDLRKELAARFAARTRAEWTEVFDAVDACVTPVLRLDEAPNDAHNQDRDVYYPLGSGWRPRAVPRFSRTPGQADQGTPARVGEHSADLLAGLGRSPEVVASLVQGGVVHLT